MRLLRRLLPLLAALALLQPAAARAEERILHFLSDVAVGKDGALDVTETIRIRAEGDEIERGIQRDFPTRYEAAGRDVRVGFDLVEVTRDGEPEPAELMAHGNGVRIRIGRADVLIPPGEHVYRIRYRTTRQLGFFEGFDELYWNATGNGWTFPIELAEARIRLPAPAPLGKRAVYTGPQGSRDANAAVVSEAPGEILFRTTAPLGREEGLTVAVAWPKGIVDPPAAEETAKAWLEQYAPLIAGLLGLLAILAYYFHAWRRAGRDPRAGTIVPLFSPPDDLSPAAMRYISEMGLDSRAFAAALVDLGVRGHIRLVEGEKGFFTRRKTTIHKLRDADSALPEPEAAMMGALFAGGDSILMDDENHATFRSARSALEAPLKKRYEGSLFLLNWGWSLRGLMLMLGALWLSAAVALLAAPDYYGSGGRGIALASVAGFAAAGALYLWARGRDGAAALLAKMAAIAIFLPSAGAGFGAVGTAMELGSPLAILVPLLALPLVVSAFWWMPAPTGPGRKMLDRIAGFRQYLSIAEEERLEAMHPPEKTPELFERYLPYAIALEVENAWASRFTSILAAAAAAPGQAGTMGWYSGHSDPWSDPGDFVDRVGSSLSSTVSSSSTAPGSSSGSGGGGSSGGGGGGGGGSGW